MIETMKKSIYIVWIAFIVLVAWILFYHADWLVIPPFEKVHAEQKSDGECTGHETAGRCADKCPLPTDQGVYYLQGFDKETGAAICGFSYYHQCPYTDAVSADDPLCYKSAPAQNPDPVDAPIDVNGFQGK